VGVPVFLPAFSLAGVIILTAEKGAPDTAADHMIVRRIGEADLARTGDGHDVSPLWSLCLRKVEWE